MHGFGMNRFEQSQTIAGMNERNQRQGSRQLVALQVADQVPSHWFVRQYRSFAPELLGAAFPQVGASRGKQTSRFCGADELGYGDESNFRTLTPAARRGRGNSCANLLHVFGDSLRGIHGEKAGVCAISWAFGRALLGLP